MGWQEFVAAGRIDEAHVAKQLETQVGGTVRIATPNEDIYDHVDFWWTKPDGVIVGVDVKGMKKRNRSDPRPDNDITWLELKNVHGDAGWLYGKATYFAFRRIGLTVFVNRQRLVCYAETVVRGKQVVDRRPAACGIPYTRSRWGRNDVTVMVPLDDIQALAEFVLPT